VKLCSLKRIRLGQGHVDQLTLFEWKYVGGVYLYFFNVKAQDRFHTHAFASVSFLLWGRYFEEVKNPDGTIVQKTRHPGVKYLPRDYNHKLMESAPNTISLTITGPWDRYWTEESDKWIRV
jgi:hypothetical protein